MAATRMPDQPAIDVPVRCRTSCRRGSLSSLLGHSFNLLLLVLLVVTLVLGPTSSKRYLMALGNAISDWSGLTRAVPAIERKPELKLVPAGLSQQALRRQLAALSITMTELQQQLDRALQAGARDRADAREAALIAEQRSRTLEQRLLGFDRQGHELASLQQVHEQQTQACAKQSSTLTTLRQHIARLDADLAREARAVKTSQTQADTLRQQQRHLTEQMARLSLEIM